MADSALSRFQLFIRNKVLLKKKKIYRTVIASKTIRLTIVFVVFIRLNYAVFVVDRAWDYVRIRCAKRDFFFFVSQREYLLFSAAAAAAAIVSETTPLT